MEKRVGNLHFYSFSFVRRGICFKFYFGQIRSCSVMKCTLCGFEFSEESAHAACGGCGFVKGCELVKCPRCDFENGPEPKWIKKLFLKQERQKNQKSLQESDLRLD